MRSSAAKVTLVVALLLAVPLFALGDTAIHASVVSRHLHRIVASPVDAVPDDMRFRVEVGRGNVTELVALANASSVFVLHVFPEDASGDVGSPAPGSSRSFLLSGPSSGPADAVRAWRVSVDPVAGALVDVDVTLRGFVSDVGGAPAVFGFSDEGFGDGCARIPVGACLP